MKPDIPEPECFLRLRIFPDYSFGDGDVYVWDRNGVPRAIEEITGKKEELDDRFRAWAKKYDSQPSDREPFDYSKKERRAFDDEGRRLAKELFDLLEERSVIIYEALDGTRTRYEGKA